MDLRWHSKANRQRQEYLKKKKNKPTHLTNERIHNLEEIRLVWKAKMDDEGWVRMLEELLEYKGKHGDCLVPRIYEVNQMGKHSATALSVQEKGENNSDDRRAST